MNALRLITAMMGFLAAALAIARDDRTLVWIAIGLLGSSVVVRVVQKVQSKGRPGDDDPPDRDG